MSAPEGELPDGIGDALSGAGQAERLPPERIDTTVLVADEAGLGPARIDTALREAGRPRTERDDIATRTMQLAVTGLAIVAVGTDTSDRIVLELSNTVQDVIEPAKQR